MRPRYRDWDLAELRRRAALAVESLQECRVCPRDCRVNRLEDEAKVCSTGRYAKLSTWFPHFGEEDCLRGRHGSGTLFFSFCNLKCVFCQNHDTSQAGHGRVMAPQALAAAMLDLQAKGCHNINFVTPEHVVPQLLEALPIAIERGLTLPLIYNTSSYDSLESLAWLDGLIDIYMPDFKLWSSEASKRYLKAKDYPQVAKRVVLEMQRQVGSLRLYEAAPGLELAQSGVLVRHLVMPGLAEESRAILEFLAHEVAGDTYVNVMAQFRPEYRADEYPEINRQPSYAEVRAARDYARELGLRLDRRAPERHLELLH
ncbi:MAG: radical SAM protein [Polyangiaceae bacterium]|nr:radical SAM protein [Myxococcales bacterium]MCB9586535.1 radical SAM protein [Polyangiaceae bacterium]MCB9606042.1 radical SAM protein [Polyangiaceae bacterium]